MDNENENGIQRTTDAKLKVKTNLNSGMESQSEIEKRGAREKAKNETRERADSAHTEDDVLGEHGPVGVRQEANSHDARDETLSTEDVTQKSRARDSRGDEAD